MKVIHVIMIVMLMGLVTCTPIFGEDTGTTLTTATFYDVPGNTLMLGVIVPVISFNKVVSLDAGLLTEMSSISYMVGLGIDLKELAAKFKWKWDLSEKIKIGTYGARDFGNKVWRFGAYIGIQLEI